MNRRSPRISVCPTTARSSARDASFPPDPESGDEFARVDVERAGESGEVDHTNVAFTAFYRRHIGPVESAAVGEVFGGESGGGAGVAEPCAELREDLALGWGRHPLSFCER